MLFFNGKLSGLPLRFRKKVLDQNERRDLEDFGEEN